MKTLPLLVAIAFMATSPAHADLIRVQGSAEAKHPPDIAWINVEVWSRSKVAKRAQELSAEEQSRVMDVLTRDFKIKKDQIRTSSYQLSPEYDWNSNKRTLKGYYAQQSIEVTIHALDKMGNLMDELSSDKKADAASGVNLEGIRFGTEKRAAYEIAVIEDAMKDARARADAIARAAGGRSVKAVRNVTQGAPTFSSPILPMAMGALAEKQTFARAAAPTQISTGEITISTEVTVEYEF